MFDKKDSKIIKNYANLIDSMVCDDKIKSEKILKQLKIILNLFNTDSNISRFFTSELASVSDKKSLLSEFLKKLNFSVLDELEKIFTIMFENNAEKYLQDIIVKYEELHYLRVNSKIVRLLSSQKFNSKDLSSLKSYLEQKLDCDVILENKIDDSLIKGFVISYDSYMIDYSLKHKLEMLSLEMKSKI